MSWSGTAPKRGRCIAHVWLRSGNTTSACGATAFLAEVLALCAGRVNIALVRADSGFFDDAILTALEATQVPYAIVARFTSLLHNLIGELQRSLGQRPIRTLATLRTTLFACGAIRGADGRQPMLRLSRATPWQATFLAHLSRLLPKSSNCNAVAVTEAKI